MIDIVSIYNGNIPAEVLKAQRDVMVRLGHGDHHRQVRTDLQHPDALDDEMAKSEAEIVVFMDIDCIPVHEYAIIDIVKQIQRYDAIIGAEQCASHIPGCIDYASPAFVAIRQDLYEKAGRPSFKPTERGDVGTELTHACIENNVNIQLLNVISVEQPKWSLNSGRMFGIGTLYYPGIYHAFESRMNLAARNSFIQKAKGVLSR